MQIYYSTQNMLDKLTVIALHEFECVVAVTVVITNVYGPSLLADTCSSPLYNLLQGEDYAMCSEVGLPGVKYGYM